MNTNQIFFVAILSLLAAANPCQQGQVLAHNNVCLTPKYIEGCFQYASKHQCHQCQFRYSLTQNGLCTIKTSVHESCCAEQDSPGNCRKCQKGLALVQGACQEVRILGCLEKTEQGQCTNCASNFVLVEGACKEAIRNCKSYVDSDAEICQACHEGFNLMNNMCLKNTILGCQIENEAGGCKKCYEPIFRLVDKHCEVDNCRSVNEYGCIACECGFYLTEGGICNEMMPGCLRYQRGVCTDCQKNWISQRGVCIIEGCLKMNGLECDQCQENYVKGEYGICEIENCQKWSNGVCEICKPFFELKDGACRKVIATQVLTATGGVKQIRGDLD